MSDDANRFCIPQSGQIWRSTLGEMRPPDAKERGAPTEAASRKATSAWAETDRSFVKWHSVYRVQRQCIRKTQNAKNTWSDFVSRASITENAPFSKIMENFFPSYSRARISADLACLLREIWPEPCLPAIFLDLKRLIFEFPNQCVIRWIHQ